MFDSAQRNIHYLRLSVTDLCNLRCRYCMPDGVEKLEREALPLHWVWQWTVPDESLEPPDV